MATPYLKRFEAVVLKNKSGSDPAQIPTAATVTFYAPGSTVKQAVTIPLTVDPVAVLVYDNSPLAAGMTLVVDGGANRLLIDSMVGTDTLNVLNQTAHTISLAVGARLSPASGQPLAYADALGINSLGSSIATDAATGRAACYVRAKTFDYVVTGSGIATRVYPDADGAFVTSETGWLNAMQFATVQAAVNALPAGGGVVFLPTGRYVLSSGLLLAAAGVTLIGEGGSTIITTDVQHRGTFDLVTVTGAHCQIRDLVIDGAMTGFSTPGANTKNCLLLDGSQVTDDQGLRFTAENVTCQNSPKHGLVLQDCTNSLLVNCLFPFNSGDGCNASKITKGTNGTQFINCYFSENYWHGLRADGCSRLGILGGGAEGNSQDRTTGTGTTDGSSIVVTNSDTVRIEASDFEGAGPPGNLVAVDNYLYFDSATCCVISTCNFSGASMTQHGFRSGPNGTPELVLIGCTWNDFLGGTSSPTNAVAVVQGANSVVAGHRIGNSTQNIAVLTANAIKMTGGAVIMRYPTQGDLPAASAVEPGTIAYLDTPPLGYPFLVFSDGSHWLFLVQEF